MDVASNLPYIVLEGSPCNLFVVLTDTRAPGGRRFENPPHLR